MDIDSLDILKMLEVEGLVRHTSLKEGETIEDDFEIVEMASLISEIAYYWRDKEECPFNRGNLVVYFKLKDGNIFCLKFMSQTTEEEIKAYLTPLIKLLKKQKLKGMH